MNVEQVKEKIAKMDIPDLDATFASRAEFLKGQGIKLCDALTPLHKHFDPIAAAIINKRQAKVHGQY